MVILASAYDQSRYIKAEDLEADRKLRIKNVTEEQIGIGADKEQKLVVWFTNDERGLVLNRVNNRTLRSAFGDDCAGWAGKIIIVFPAMAEFRGRMVPAVRVRFPPPKEAGNGAAVTPKPKPPVADALDEITADLAKPKRGRPRGSKNQSKAAAAAKPSVAEELDDEIPW
jgi:hypothetical protein